MPSWLKKSLQFGLSLLAGLLLLWWVFQGQDMEAIKTTLRGAHFEWIIASGIAALWSHWLRALRWRMLMEPLGAQPSKAVTYHAVMFGYLANLALPRMGELTRCGAINRKTKLPINSLLGTVIIERAIDMVLLLVFTTLTILLNFSLLRAPLFKFIDKFLGFQLLGLPLWLVGLSSLLGGLAAIWWYRKKLSGKLNHPVIVKGKGFLRGLWAGIKSVRALRHPVIFVLYSIGIWVGYYLMTYCCVFAFDSTSMLNPNEGLLILIAGSFGFVAPVQGGIGAYHAVISRLLVILPGRSISLTDALSFATLTHAAQTLLVMFAGFISMVVLFSTKHRHVAKK